MFSRGGKKSAGRGAVYAAFRLFLLPGEHLPQGKAKVYGICRGYGVASECVVPEQSVLREMRKAHEPGPQRAHHYALVAGFTEIGETLEQTVEREVMEEVGLKVKNIRYYKSQPWGLSGSLLAGFFCDLDGDDTITLQEDELKEAEWFEAADLTPEADGISLTREMMAKFRVDHTGGQKLTTV